MSATSRRGVVSHFLAGIEYGFDRGFERWSQSSAAGHEHVSSPGVTETAISYLKGFEKETRPFFLFAHYFDPHYDYLEHAGFAFSDAQKTPTLRSRGNNIWSLRRLSGEGSLSEDTLRYLRDCYDSEIAFTDHHVGQLLDYLKQEGLYDDALIVFLSDHGEMFGGREDRWIGHTRYLYDELIHVPLLIKLPHQGRVGRVEQPVSTVDLYPTVLDALSHPAAPGERSLLDRGRLTMPPVFSRTRKQATRDSVIEGKWKLIRDHEAKKDQLFDLSADPGEQTDVASAHPAQVQHLAGLLTEWSTEQERQGRKLARKSGTELSKKEIEKLRALGYIETPTPK